MTVKVVLFPNAFSGMKVAAPLTVGSNRDFSQLGTRGITFVRIGSCELISRGVLCR